MADGGEGTLDILMYALSGELRRATVADALGRPVTALFGRTYDGTLVVESAQACGLDHVAHPERDPLRASTFGVGALVALALDAEPAAKRVLLTLGGSATADGGYGALCALGAQAFDDDDRPLPSSPDALDALVRFELARLDPRLRELELRVLCDVRSPLLGPEGARRYFAQKGADATTLVRLHARLERLVRATRIPQRVSCALIPGAGAAGGLGFAAALCGGHLVEGADFVANTINLNGCITSADLVLTGEGTVDGQTLVGKGPACVVERARRIGRPVVMLGGRVSLSAHERLAFEDIEVIAVSEGVEDERAMHEAPERLARAAVEAVARHQRS